MKKALIAMSGGVDSSVTAYLMKEQGFDCIGVTFRMFDKSLPMFSFPSDKQTDSDINDAKTVCERLGIPFYTLDVSEKFRKYVIDDFIRCYEKGATPNPCIMCNKHIKFSLLADFADKLGCDVIATGHYSRIEKDSCTGRYYIVKADDITKDQSYVLYPLTQDILSRTYFPLADITKEEAREIAVKNNLITARKKDSQDICFIPDGDYASFLTRATEKKYPRGKYIDINGNFLGMHNGHINYTVGQRKGLGIALGQPMYVKSKDYRNNTVTLSTNEQLFEREIIVDNFNFMLAQDFAAPTSCSAKIRYSHADMPATAYQLDEYKIKLIFDEPQRAPSKGQSAVLYDGNKVLGGGIII